MAIDASEDQWVEGMTLNFDRHRQLTQELLPNFLEQRSGSIVSISGNLEPEAVNAAMVAKAGLVVCSKGLSEQLGQHGITVNCVQPGLIDTAQIRRFYPGDERRKFAEREIALRDFGEPEDVANAVTFLASPRARYITGMAVCAATRSSRIAQNLDTPPVPSYAAQQAVFGLLIVPMVALYARIAPIRLQI
jgi:3-oxoacyl-[acyl-carrier protein] reductase